MVKPGLHLVHKPAGATSFSIVQEFIDASRAARPGKRPRACHGGALDPFATGLLPVLVGPATRLFDHLHDVPKVYQATIAWGAETDNGDPGGAVTSTGDASQLTPATIEGAADAFRGWQDQVPPATSNKRVGGERAYVRAHRGEQVILPPCRVYLHAVQWLAHDLPRSSTVRLAVRGGYYARAFARDLGRRLGCYAHLGSLTRTAIGPYADPPAGERVHVGGHGLLSWLPSRVLTDQEVGDLRQSRTIPTGGMSPPEWTPTDGFPTPTSPIRAFHRDRLVFLLMPKDGQLAAATGLPGGL